MKKKELMQQIVRLPDDTEITFAGNPDFDVVKISRKGITTVSFEAADSQCGCACKAEVPNEN